MDEMVKACCDEVGLELAACRLKRQDKDVASFRDDNGLHFITHLHLHLRTRLLTAYTSPTSHSHTLSFRRSQTRASSGFD